MRAHLSCRVAAGRQSLSLPDIGYGGIHHFFQQIVGSLVGFQVEGINYKPISIDHVADQRIEGSIKTPNRLDLHLLLSSGLPELDRLGATCLVNWANGRVSIASSDARRSQVASRRALFSLCMSGKKMRSGSSLSMVF